MKPNTIAGRIKKTTWKICVLDDISVRNNYLEEGGNENIFKHGTCTSKVSYCHLYPRDLVQKFKLLIQKFPKFP